MFPIAFEIHAATAKHHVEPVLGVLMIAGSCSLISPYAYQTNLMVTETAGYKPKDFLKFGGPLLMLICAVCTLLASYVVWGDGPGKFD